MAVALTNARVLLPTGLQEGPTVVVEGDRIRSVGEAPPEGATVVDLQGKLLLPGFIDVQVNGGGGRLFNDEQSVETIATIAAAHRPFGTTGLLPTLISDDIAVVERGIAAVDRAIEAGVPGVVGIHIEGPFLSIARRGIHLESMLQRFEDRFVDLLSAGHHGRTLVTIAPECASPAQIRRLVDAGVIVCAGHSDADYETVRAALDAGMTGFTHLFNGMSQLRNRAPGMVGAALEDRSAYAGIIVDGHHIHPASFRVALAAKGRERLMLVTDAMATVGADNQEFMLQGRRIRRKADKLVSDDGTLAGSDLTMAGAVANAIEQGRIDLAEAVGMATVSPATFLGIASETGSIAPGLRADFVIADDFLTVSETWIAGVRQWSVEGTVSPAS
jgi:N-acetylglucosamine-6-phosphate deacetylase